MGLSRCEGPWAEGCPSRASAEGTTHLAVRPEVWRRELGCGMAGNLGAFMGSLDLIPSMLGSRRDVKQEGVHSDPCHKGHLGCVENDSQGTS